MAWRFAAVPDARAPRGNAGMSARPRKEGKMTRWRFLLSLLPILALGALHGACLDPTHVYVDAAAPEAGNGSEVLPFRTITEGLAAVADGGSVHVAGGDYAENLRVERPCKVLGAGSDQTRLQVDVTERGIDILSDDVEIAGLAVAGEWVEDLQIAGLAGIRAAGVDNVVIRDNEVSLCGWIGIHASYGQNVRIENNRVHRILNAAYDGAHGIAAGFVEDLTIRGNLLEQILYREEGDLYLYFGGVGILLGPVSGIIENNVARDNGVGIGVMHSHDEITEMAIRGNRMEQNWSAGLAFTDALVNELTDNDVVDNRDAGLALGDIGTSTTEILSCDGNVLLGNHPDFDEPYACDFSGNCHWIPEEIKACFSEG